MISSQNLEKIIYQKWQCSGCGKTEWREYAIKATIEKLETIKGDLFVSKPEYEFVEIEKNESHNKSLHLTFARHIGRNRERIIEVK